MLTCSIQRGLEDGKKVSNTSAAEILRPSSLPDKRYLTLFRPILENRNVGKFLNLIVLPSNFYVFFTRITKHKREKVRITYPKKLVPHQKTFDLEIGRIDHGRRFRSSGNGAWSIRFETPHANGLSGSLGTLNVKGSIGEAISRRSNRLTRRLLATPSIVRGDGLRDRRGRSRWRRRGQKSLVDIIN